LCRDISAGRGVGSGDGERTISSSLIPFAFPHALITHASLNAVTATISTPLAFSFDKFSMYPGKWLAEQVGVKAPGVEKRTTFLLAHSVIVQVVSVKLHECGMMIRVSGK